MIITQSIWDKHLQTLMQINMQISSMSITDKVTFNATKITQHNVHTSAFP